MENELEKGTTYVLFGNEAIRIYKMSLKLLLSSTHVRFKVGAFKDVGKFVKEAQKWDDFIEVNEEDYIKLNNTYLRNLNKDKTKGKRTKKTSIFRLFK